METYLTSFLKFVFLKKMILTVILHGDVRTGTVLLPKATGYQTKTQVPVKRWDIPLFRLLVRENQHGLFHQNMMIGPCY